MSVVDVGRRYPQVFGHGGAEPYSDTVLALSPSLYWALDADTGATDLSGNGRNGTGAGSITIGGFASSPIAGESTSTDFDGSDDQITTTYDPFTNATDRTYSGWAWRDVNTNYHHLFGDVGGGDITLRLDDATSDITATVTVATTWNAGWPGTAQWVHWALTVDETANILEFYVNGATLGTKSNAGFTYPAHVSLLLGARSDGLRWDGKMAHFAVFESELSAANIAALYAGAA
jgi:hypothetical protein